MEPSPGNQRIRLNPGKNTIPASPILTIARLVDWVASAKPCFYSLSPSASSQLYLGKIGLELPVYGGLLRILSCSQTGVYQTTFDRFWRSQKTIDHEMEMDFTFRPQPVNRVQNTQFLPVKVEKNPPLVVPETVQRPLKPLSLNRSFPNAERSVSKKSGVKEKSQNSLDTQKTAFSSKSFEGKPKSKPGSKPDSKPAHLNDNTDSFKSVSRKRPAEINPNRPVIKFVRQVRKPAAVEETPLESENQFQFKTSNPTSLLRVPQRSRQNLRRRAKAPGRLFEDKSMKRFKSNMYEALPEVDDRTENAPFLNKE